MKRAPAFAAAVFAAGAALADLGPRIRSTDPLQPFWHGFRRAVLANRYDEIRRFTRFPFETLLPDGSLEASHNKREFDNLFGQLADADNGKGSMREILEAKELLNAGDWNDAADGELRVGTFLFRREKNKWRFTQAYVGAPATARADAPSAPEPTDRWGRPTYDHSSQTSPTAPSILTKPGSLTPEAAAAAAAKKKRRKAPPPEPEPVVEEEVVMEEAPPPPMKVAVLPKQPPSPPAAVEVKTAVKKPQPPPAPKPAAKKEPDPGDVIVIDEAAAKSAAKKEPPPGDIIILDEPPPLPKKEPIRKAAKKNPPPPVEVVKTVEPPPPPPPPKKKPPPAKKAPPPIEKVVNEEPAPVKNTPKTVFPRVASAPNAANLPTAPAKSVLTKPAAKAPKAAAPSPKYQPPAVNLEPEKMPAPPEDLTHFRGFWYAFRTAVLNNDDAKIKKLTKFSFETRGEAEVAKTKRHNAHEFDLLWERLLQADPQTGPLRDSMREFIFRREDLTVEELAGEAQGEVTVGLFVFKKIRGKWRFTSANVDD